MTNSSRPHSPPDPLPLYFGFPGHARAMSGLLESSTSYARPLRVTTGRLLTAVVLIVVVGTTTTPPTAAPTCTLSFHPLIMLYRPDVMRRPRQLNKNVCALTPPPPPRLIPSRKGCVLVKCKMTKASNNREPPPPPPYNRKRLFSASWALGGKCVVGAWIQPPVISRQHKYVSSASPRELGKRADPGARQTTKKSRESFRCWARQKGGRNAYQLRLPCCLRPFGIRT